MEPLSVQGTLKSLLQHHSSKASILRCSVFFIVQFSHPYMTTGKSHSVMSNSLRPNELYSARFLCPWDSPGKNTGMGSHSLFQGIFPMQESNSGLLYCKQILYHLSHQESPLSTLYYKNKFSVSCLVISNNKIV